MQQKEAEPLVVGTLAAVSAHEAIHVRVSHLGNKCIMILLCSSQRCGRTKTCLGAILDGDDTMRMESIELAEQA